MFFAGVQHLEFSTTRSRPLNRAPRKQKPLSVADSPRKSMAASDDLGMHATEPVFHDDIPVDLTIKTICKFSSLTPFDWCADLRKTDRIASMSMPVGVLPNPASTSPVGRVVVPWTASCLSWLTWDVCTPCATIPGIHSKPLFCTACCTILFRHSAGLG